MLFQAKAWSPGKVHRALAPFWGRKLRMTAEKEGVLL